MTGIHVHMLSFLTAVYPVLLVATAYTAIGLYAQNDGVLRRLWRPFAIIFAKFQNSLSCSDSIIHVFATLIMLSSYSLIYDTYAIFAACSVYFDNGTHFEQVLYYDPSIALFSSEHISYLVVAVVLCFLLAVCPALLLCLYPTRIYERLSRCCSPRKRIAVSIFAEALHSCFKNGLNGTRDYRALAGLCVFGPFLFGAVKLVLKQVMPHSNITEVLGVLYLFLSFTLSYIRPCKSLIMNLSLSFHVMLFGILSIGKGLWLKDFTFNTETLAVMFVVLPTSSHVLLIVWAGYKLMRFMYRSEPN